MAKKKIFIDAKGNTMALYDDKFGAMADQIGHKEINRASEVEFNNEANVWEVRMPKECAAISQADIDEDGKCPVIMEVVATGVTRQEALDKEKEIVEGRFRKHLEDEAKLYVSSNSGCAPGLETVQPS